MELHAEVKKEIMDILEKMFPTSEQRTGGPNGTYSRVRRLMLLSQKLLIVVDGNRVVGYFRPVSGWNLGKKQEFADRVPVKMEGVDDCTKTTM